MKMKHVIVSVIVGSALLLGGLSAAQAYNPFNSCYVCFK